MGTANRAVDPINGGNFGNDINNNLYNPYDRNYYGGVSFSDVARIGVVSFVYDMPFLRGSKGLAKTLAARWQLSVL